MLSDSILSLMLDDFFHALTDTLSNFQEGREADREKGRDEYQQANQKRHHCGRNREWQSTTAENIPT